MAEYNTFGPVPDGATVIAETGGHQYLAVAWVYRREPYGKIEYYATVEAWSSTPAAQLAARDEEIAALHARIAELEARLATPLEPPPPLEPPLEVCGVDGCEVQKPAGHSIEIHRRWHTRKAHAADQAPPAPRAASVEGEGWRCADCQTDIYAKDLHDPTRCMRCMGKRAKNGNGVHA